MKSLLFFDAHNFERPYFEEQAKAHSVQIEFLKERLNEKTAVLAKGYEAVCVFVNDHVNAKTMKVLASAGVKIIALRCAGFNNIDIEAAQKLNIKIIRVPKYSPHAVAEYTVGLILCLNRKIHKSFARVRELNFSLSGLVGFDIYNKTIGIVGAGSIGSLVAQIFHAFGANILVHDIEVDTDLQNLPNLQYVSLDKLCKQSDVVSLHVPLNPQTQYLINQDQINNMKQGVLIINTGRGALIDTKALVQGLKSGKVGGAALDVYEEEEHVFFKDLSNEVLQDDVLARLLTFPNVLITSHQAFLTQEALEQISFISIDNVSKFYRNESISEEFLVRSEALVSL